MDAHDPPRGWSAVHAGQVLRGMAEAAGYTVADLARGLDKRSNTIGALFQQQNPRWHSIAELCVAIGKTPLDFARALVEASGEEWPGDAAPAADVSQSALPLLIEALESNQRSAEAQAAGMRETIAAIRAMGSHIESRRRSG